MQTTLIADYALLMKGTWPAAVFDEEYRPATLPLRLTADYENIIRTPSNLVASMAQHKFGGSWTEKKLQKLGAYLQRYKQALKKQPFRKIYVDAFAGTGYRSIVELENQPSFGFADFSELAKGSAVVALEGDPPFDSYVLIEKNRRRFEELRQLASQFPTKRDSISFIKADANMALRELCSTIDWKRNRAVLFLDPYGMQVEWETLVAIAGTQAIDTWILFPVGMGVARLLTKDGKMQPNFEVALDRIFGETNWREAFYSPLPPAQDLFGEATSSVARTADPARIEAYFVERLRSIFSGVAPKGLPLRNSKGALMYLLCFACGNPKGAPIALKIANHLLKP